MQLVPRPDGFDVQLKAIFSSSVSGRTAFSNKATPATHASQRPSLLKGPSDRTAAALRMAATTTS